MRCLTPVLARCLWQCAGCILTLDNTTPLSLTPDRAELIGTAQRLLEVLDERQQPWPATAEAWVATGSQEPGASAGFGHVVKLTRAALQGMDVARQSMAGVVECLLDWMSMLHQEMVRTGLLLDGPREGLLKVGGQHGLSACSADKAFVYQRVSAGPHCCHQCSRQSQQPAQHVLAPSGALTDNVPPETPSLGDATAVC